MKIPFRKLAIAISLLIFCTIGASAGYFMLTGEDEPSACATDYQKRYMFQVHLTAAQKAAYWQAHYQNVLNAGGLTSEQVDTIRMVQDLTTESAYHGGVNSADLESTETDWGAVNAAVQANFTAAEAYTVFGSLPEYNEGSLSSTDESDLAASPRLCTCSRGSWWNHCAATNGYDCNQPVSCRAPVIISDPDGAEEGCGFGWLFTCNSRCTLAL